MTVERESSVIRAALLASARSRAVPVTGSTSTTSASSRAEAIQEGIAAQERGDLRTATARLGRAVELAQAIKEATGNDATARLLAEVVDVDPATGPQPRG